MRLEIFTLPRIVVGRWKVVCRTKWSVDNHLWFAPTMDLTASLYERNCYMAYEIKAIFGFFSSFKWLLIKRLLLTRTPLSFGRDDDDTFWSISNGGWHYVWFWKHSISRNLESLHEMRCTNKALNCLTIFRHPHTDLSNNGYFSIGTSCLLTCRWIGWTRQGNNRTTNLRSEQDKIPYSVMKISLCMCLENKRIKLNCKRITSTGLEVYWQLECHVSHMHTQEAGVDKMEKNSLGDKLINSISNLNVIQ